MKPPIWTDDDLGYVEDTIHLPAAEVARTLGRSTGAIYAVRVKLRKGWAPVRSSWSGSELDLLRAMPHFSAPQAAEVLGRSVSAVLQRRAKLGLPHPAAMQHLPTTVANRTLLAATCLTCGLLLEASWFGRSDDRSWRAHCVRCRRPAKREEARRRYAEGRRPGNSTEKLQAVTLPLATKRNEPYTEADHEVLRDPSLTVVEKALRLHRTYRATIHQLSVNGYTSLVGRGDPVHGRWVIDNPNAERVAS